MMCKAGKAGEVLHPLIVRHNRAADLEQKSTHILMIVVMLPYKVSQTLCTMMLLLLLKLKKEDGGI